METNIQIPSTVTIGLEQHNVRWRPTNQLCNQFSKLALNIRFKLHGDEHPEAVLICIVSWQSARVILTDARNDRIFCSRQAVIAKEYITYLIYEKIYGSWDAKILIIFVLFSSWNPKWNLNQLEIPRGPRHMPLLP